MKSAGFIYSLVTALIWASAAICDKIAMTKASPIVAVTVRSFTVSVFAFSLLLYSKKTTQPFTLDLKTIFFIALAGILAGLIGQWTYFKALQNWEASRVVPVAGSYPLFAFIFSTILLSEPVTIKKISGTILVILGVILLS
ncbi:MAG: EamA family transporter [bacterium]